MINTSNYTGEDNTPRLAGPTWRSGSGTTTGTSRAAPRPGRAESLGRTLTAAGRMLLSWLAGFSRHAGDRLFAMNDTEAYWRDWQIIKVHGGLGRRYRDPRFDTLTECSKCRGAGVIATLPCLPCTGSGRIILGEVS